MSSLFLGVPSAPGQVIGTRVTDTSVLIQWSPPKEPNNLIGYYIDQCVKGTKNWTSANHKPHKSTRYFFFLISISTDIHCYAQKCVCLWLFDHLCLFFFCFCRFVVSGLTKGETYVFRVQAINELGLSDESQESAPLTVLAALCQFYTFVHSNWWWQCESDDHFNGVWIVIGFIAIKIQYCFSSSPFCSVWHWVAELRWALDDSELEEASSVWRFHGQGVLCGQKTQRNNHVEGGSYPTSHRESL